MKKPYLKYIFGTLFISLAVMVQIATIWAAFEFGTIDFASIVFHLNVPLEGTNMSPFISLVLLCIIGIIIFGSLALLAALKGQNEKKITFKIKKLKIPIHVGIWHRFYIPFAVGIFIILLLINAHAIALDTYIINQFKTSTLIEDEYVNPENVALSFPEEKRNIIYILLESMEISFSSPTCGGAFTEQLIPELTMLQLNNINFSNNKEMLNGAYCPTGTTWSIASLVAQTSGVPLLMPIGQNKLGKHSTFLPGAYTLGEVLEREGYNQYFMLGSSAEFSGIGDYLSQHGNYSVYDHILAQEIGDIPKDYDVFWGMEDAKLYDFAKRELTELASKDGPFSFSLFTIDTHFPNGYICNKCSKKHGSDQYDNVIDCADRMLKEFLDWLKQQPYYENTTIVICGDHPTMNHDYAQKHIESVYGKEHYERKVYTTILNSAIEYDLDTTREYAVFDMYPTMLAAMGVTIEGNKMGLGVNLFSEEKTLIERYGLEYINEEFQKVSEFYKAHILYSK